MRVVIVRAGVVENVVIGGDDFAAPDGATIVQLSAGQGCEPGWLYDGATFSRPAVPIGQAKKRKREGIASRLAQAERAGFVFQQAARIASDADSLARVSILALRAQRAKDDGQAISVRLVAVDDTALTLNRQEILDLAKAAGDHFLACSDNARTLRQAVAAATTAAEVDAVDLDSGWPA